MADSNYSFNIKEIELKNGQKILPKKINIIVGPNNAGKSRFLKDIKLILNSNLSKENSVIVNDMKYVLPTDKESFIEAYKLRDKIYKLSENQIYIKTFSGIKDKEIGIYDNGINMYESDMNSLNPNWEEELSKWIDGINQDSSQPKIIREKQETIRDIFFNDDGTQTVIDSGEGGYTEVIDINESIDNFIRTYGKLFFSYLGTEEKLMLCKKQTNYGLQVYQSNFLSETKLEKNVLKDLSSHVISLFGKDIILDYYTLGQEIAFRVGDNFNNFRNKNRDNSDGDRKLFNYPLLDDEGDGLKNFVSTFITLKNNDKNVILIDEPESFLHPPLARRMGETIAKSSKDNKQIFISTHSDDIIDGIITKTTDVNIIRITRKGNINNIELIETDEVKKVTKNPVLVASNLLKGLFSEKVYITESFADTLVYQQIATKVDEFSSIYFVNTQGKDKISDAIKFYDRLKVNNIAIYDFDYFRDQNTIYKSLYHKIGNSNDYEEISKFKIELERYIVSLAKQDLKSKGMTESQLGKDEYKEELKRRKSYYYHSKGINCLDDELKSKANKAINILKDNNIIVLKNGCLECSLIDVSLEYTHNKNSWLENAINILDKMKAEELERLEVYNELFK